MLLHLYLRSSGALSTRGAWCFRQRRIDISRAFDDRDGKVLWESLRLNDIPNAFPITYMVDGKQYIAMPVGNPGLQSNSALYAAAENGAVRGSKSSMLWVWELPSKLLKLCFHGARPLPCGILINWLQCFWPVRRVLARALSPKNLARRSRSWKCANVGICGGSCSAA